jgi:hypothetical protein
LADWVLLTGGLELLLPFPALLCCICTTHLQPLEPLLHFLKVRSLLELLLWVHGAFCFWGVLPFLLFWVEYCCNPYWEACFQCGFFISLTFFWIVMSVFFRVVFWCSYPNLWVWGCLFSTSIECLLHWGLSFSACSWSIAPSHSSRSGTENNLTHFYALLLGFRNVYSLNLCLFLSFHSFLILNCNWSL